MHRKTGAAKLAIAAAWVTIAAVATVAAVLVAPASSTAGVTAAARLPVASGGLTKVIVMLRDEPAGLRVRSLARGRLLNSELRPLAALLRAHGARNLAAGRSLPFMVASVSEAQRKALESSPRVLAVVPDSTIAVPRTSAPSTPFPQGPPATGRRLQGRSSLEQPIEGGPSICGTANDPESDPEAINVIDAPQANDLGYDGAGVTVGYIAGPIDTTLADFQRNAAYASPGSGAGSPVLTSVNFSGDPDTTPSTSDPLESFLDASSIAAQGNTVYNLDNYVSSTHSLPSPCDISLTGSAPGASVLGLDAWSSEYETTLSSYLQAIDYSVSQNVKVLNESFGFDRFPDTALDALKIADDDAVGAGVTVVVSSGDSGVTSTIQSPASDPNLITVGASTTFRAYEQNFYGAVNATTPNANNGRWLDNNISSLSSGGFTQEGGNTVDLVAPGDFNWILCSTNTALYPDCTNDNGSPSPIQFSGGTSESAPLTAGAAADVIQAYASTHGGTDPSPALVKQILMSTATDIDAPAEQQGAGLLDVLAAVKEAASIQGTTATPQGGVLVSPGQINVTQDQGATAKRQLSLTNTGSSSVTVNLSTRAFSNTVASQNGDFCLNPSSSATGSCGPPTANTFQGSTGGTDVYQEETFSVPSTTAPSRLDFSADYPYTGQSSYLHVALFDPSGAYAGYSTPQGLADYANIQVADPAAGTWTAVFFTEQDGATSGAIGTGGTIQWQASTYGSGSAGSVSPSSLTIPAGGTSKATFTATSPTSAGDAAQSIVLSTQGGATNTIPVTVRTMVPVQPGPSGGGTFSGVLTGGNGSPGPSQTNSYTFKVPADQPSLRVSVTFADSQDAAIAYLVAPDGQAVASGSTYFLNSSGAGQTGGSVDLYHPYPQPGGWTLVVDWLNPVSGAELSEPFSGVISFRPWRLTSGGLPDSRNAELKAGRTYTYKVTAENGGEATENLFTDPRLNVQRTITLPDQNGSEHDMSLPLSRGQSPEYVVPPYTTALTGSLTGNQPVTFDMGYVSGDPDVSPAVTAPDTSSSSSGDSASVTLNEPEVAPGLWYLNPSEVGPYASTGAPSATASASVKAATKAFDSTVTSSTGDWWSEIDADGPGVTPVNIAPGSSGIITVHIKPTGPAGHQVSGIIYLDDYYPNLDLGQSVGQGDVAAIPYSYVLSGPADLSLTDAATAKTKVGRRITETLKVTDHGPDPSTGATLTDRVPAGTTFYSVSSSSGSCHGGATVTCSLGTIERGSTAKVVLVLTADKAEKVRNHASVHHGHEPDPNAANNAATATTTVESSRR